MERRDLADCLFIVVILGSAILCLTLFTYIQFLIWNAG